MESETSNGYRSERRESDGVGGGGLGFKLQRTESFPYKTLMMNHNRQFEGGVVGVHSGPNFEIYDGVGFGVAAGGLVQPFKGGMAATPLRFPFTSAQWMELERQALIYKHMVASAPIPPDLLLPISRSLSDSVAISASHAAAFGRASGFNLRFSNNTDPEPGRCKRTDGKKWRCSRDVAPDQKYCERHMNRGRPRSRKHVEVQPEINNNQHHNNNKDSNVARPIPPTLAASNTNATSNHGSSRPYNQPYGFFTKPDYKVPHFEPMASHTPYKETRSMEWMFKAPNAPMAASNPDLLQLMQGKTNSVTSSSVYPQHYQENLNLNSYADFGEAQQESDQCCMYLNTELAPLDDHMTCDEKETPRRFIDAWSNARDDNPSTGHTNKSSAPSSENLSPSTLSLSMSGDNGVVGEDMDQIQMGLNVVDSERENGGGMNIKSPPLSWMTPVSWMASTPGGPLGEVLQSSAKGCNSNRVNSMNRSSGNGSGGLNLMTDGWIGSNETSPRTTTISSPSGVLQKTFASLSDSSGNSSPTFTASAKSEIALQWMHQSKLPST